MTASHFLKGHARALLGHREGDVGEKLVAQQRVREVAHEELLGLYLTFTPGLAAAGQLRSGCHGDRRKLGRRVAVGQAAAEGASGTDRLVAYQRQCPGQQGDASCDLRGPLGDPLADYGSHADLALSQFDTGQVGQTVEIDEN